MQSLATPPPRPWYKSIVVWGLIVPIVGVLIALIALAPPMTQLTVAKGDPVKAWVPSACYAPPPPPPPICGGDEQNGPGKAPQVCPYFFTGEMRQQFTTFPGAVVTLVVSYKNKDSSDQEDVGISFDSLDERLTILENATWNGGPFTNPKSLNQGLDFGKVEAGRTIWVSVPLLVTTNGFSCGTTPLTINIKAGPSATQYVGTATLAVKSC